MKAIFCKLSLVQCYHFAHKVSDVTASAWELNQCSNGDRALEALPLCIALMRMSACITEEIRSIQNVNIIQQSIPHVIKVIT
jgi:hypothetical protein